MYVSPTCADADKLMPKVKVFEAPGQGWIVVQIAEYYLPRKVQLLFFLDPLKLRESSQRCKQFSESHRQISN